MWPFKKKFKGHRVWRGYGVVKLDDDTYGSMEFYVICDKPIQDPWFLERELRVSGYQYKGYDFIPSTITIPDKKFWRMTFTVNRNM